MNINNYEEILCSTKPFKYLDLHEFDIIKGYCKIIVFHKNELLFKQGKKNVGMLVILKGSALVIAKTLGKNILNLATLEKGNFFGEVSLFQKASCAATVIADNEVHCLALTSNYFDMLTLFYPKIRYKITRAITEEVCERLQMLFENITQTLKKINMSNVAFCGKHLARHSEKVELTTFENSKLKYNDLLHSSFFQTYTDDELSLLINNSELIKVAKGVVLIKEEELHPEYYIIIRGAVQLSIVHENKKAKLAVLSPISIFSSISNIIDTKSMINYITCERAILLKISRTKIKEIEQNNKSLWYKLYNSLSESFIASERAANKLIIRLNSELYNR